MRQGTSDPPDRSLPRTVGDRFEAAWKSARSLAARPRIHDYLVTVPEPERSTAFRILLAVELRCRREAGEQPRPEEYAPDFPEAGELIDSVFAQLATRDLRPTLLKPNGTPTPDARTPGRSDSHLTVDFTPTGESAYAAAEPPPAAADTAKKKAVRTGGPDSREASAVAAPVGLPVLPGYEFLAELGKGGMGIVYKARHLRLQRLVALKMLGPGQHMFPEDTQLERFLIEARAVAQLQHPNLVQIYEIGEHDGKPYLSLELLEGGNLNDKLAGTPLAAAEAAALLETLAKAVDYAHQKGIVHRDLKPSNILLTRDGVPKVADFGLAKQMDQDSGHTEEGGILGTPSYMAPEQAWGRSSAAGPAADIYALGAILYEMLTGRPPFKAASKWATVELVRSQEPVPPRQLVPQVPRDLELICLKCLQKEPLQRFPRALDLADDLRRFQEGLPIRTRPTPWWEQAWKWTRRRPAVAALLAVSALALLSLVLYLDQRATVAQRERNEQVQTEQQLRERRAKAEQLRSQSREAVARNALPDAQAALGLAFQLVSPEPALADLHSSLIALQTEVTERQQAEDIFQQAFRLRDDALFHGMVFTGVDLPVSVAATRTACQRALALFDVTPGSTNEPRFPKYFSAQQRQQAGALCYELLLIWAEAEAQPQPGQQFATRAQLETALKLVERAARLSLPPTAAYHMRLARYLQLLDQPAAAVAERQRAATTRPAGALDYFLTGDLLQKQGHPEPAATAFAQALRVQPDHFWARYFLAVCNLQALRPAQARDNLSACLVARPNLVWLYVFRGFAHGQLNELAAAEEDYQRALTLRPDAPARYGILVNLAVMRANQARRAEGWTALAWPLPVMPNLPFAAQGVAELSRRQSLGAAEELLRQAVQLQPAQYPAYRYLALVAQQQQRLDEAVELLGQALTVARDQASSVRALLYGQRARCHRARKDLDAALADLDQALRLAPSAADHLERGRILHLRRQYTEALTAYEAALALYPAQAEVYRYQAEALLALRRPAEAADALEQFLARGGRPTAELYRTRGRIHAQLRQFPSALADYTQAVSLQPDSASHAARGWVLLANELPLLALQDFEAALRLDAHRADAYAGRGLVRVRQGQYLQALADAEMALLQGRPETSQLLWNTAHVYAQLAGRLAADPGARNPRAGLTRDRCQEQALKYLHRALERLPAAERADFWRNYIAADALLQPIRGSAGFARLEREYGKGTGR